jgi:hypothetical protein
MMTIDESMRVLLSGICGPDVTLIATGSKVSKDTVYALMRGEAIGEDSRDRIGLWLFRRINRTVVLTEDEQETPC